MKNARATHSTRSFGDLALPFNVSIRVGRRGVGIDVSLDREMRCETRARASFVGPLID